MVRSGRRRSQRIVLAFLGFVAAGLLTLAVAPSLLAPWLSRWLSARSGASVRIGWISINPALPRVTLHDVSLAPADGAAAIVSARSVGIDLGLQRTVGGEPTLDALVIIHPWVALQRTASGDFNLAALARPPAETPAPQPRTEPSASSRRPLHVRKLRILDGTIQFRDETTTPILDTSLYLDDVSARGVELAGDRAAIDIHAESRLEGEPLTLAVRYQADAGDSELTGTIATTGASLSRSLLYVPLGWQRVDGTLDVELRYRRRVQAAKLTEHALSATARLHDVEVGEPWADEPTLRVRDVRLGSLAVDFMRQRTEIGAIAVDDFAAVIARTPDGVRLPLTGDSGGGPDSGWQTRMRAVRIGRGSVLLRDLLPGGEPTWTVPVTGGALRFGESAVDLDLDATVAGGKLDVEARAGDTVRVRFGLDSLALPEVAARFALPVAFVDGEVDGELVGTFGTDAPRFEGTLTLREAKSAPDPAHPTDVFAWQTLHAEVRAATFAPLRVQLARLEADWPYVMLHRRADAWYPAVLWQAREASPVPPVADTTWLEVDALVIRNGRLELYDTTVTPAYGTELAEIQAALRAVTATPLTIADLSLAGALDELSPVRVRGAVAPRQTRVDAEVDRLLLPPLNPYLGPLLGHDVVTGVATIDSHLTVEGARLDTRNDVVLSRLDLDARDGDDLRGELGVPLTVALALMKDVRGDVRLALPIHGDLEAQRYRLGGFVSDALRTALVGAISSPVRLLGSLFRREEELHFDLRPVPFAPGVAMLGPDGDERVAQVARLLGRQPRLRARLLAVPSAADVAHMREASGVTGEQIAALGDARSEAVAHALVNVHGVDAARVERERSVPALPEVDAPPSVDVQLRGE